ncbi:MAG: hypothetical protein MJ096_06275 [Clostridia bacterium]|nr:hypothetical protein [Clostridia bacterium]
MTALIIIAAVFGLIALLLLSMIRLHLVSDGDLKVTAGVGFISFPVYPSKEKKKKKSLSQKKYLKLMKEEPEKPEEKEKEKKKDKKEKGGLRETIGFVREIIGRLGEFSRRLHTEIRSLNVSVGGKDAAAAAVTYGAVTQGVSYLIELLDCNTKLKIPDPEKTSVRCDFTSEKFGLDADLMLKIRVFSALKTVIQILIIKMKRDGKKS